MEQNRMSNEENVIEKDMITSKQLAEMLAVSEGFIKKHRAKIHGSVRIGKIWRFSKSEINARLKTGRDILIKR
jgi:hypothetical protein